MLTMWTLVVVVNSLDDVEASTTSGEYVAQPDDENFRRMLVWARANPGGRQLEPAPPLPSSSVQLVGVDVRRVERKARVTDSETTDDDTSMTSTLSDEATSSDTRQLHLNRIRSVYTSLADRLPYFVLNFNTVKLWNIFVLLAATLCGSRPGVQSASPKTPKIQVFKGHPAPRGRTAPIFQGTQLDPDM